jgi:hypothetical protein
VVLAHKPGSYFKRIDCGISMSEAVPLVFCKITVKLNLENGLLVVLYSGQFFVSGGKIPAFYSHETHPLREKDVQKRASERERESSRK